MEQPSGETSFKKFYDDNYRMLYYYVYTLINDSLASEDIVVDAFVKIWSSGDKNKNLDDLKGYMYAVCRNAAFDYLRNAKRMASLQKELAYQDIVIEQQSKNAETEAKLMDLFYREIEGLPLRCKEIFKLMLKDASVKEIAKQLQISPSTVQNQKARASKLLKTAIRKKFMCGQGELSTACTPLF
jgi:RNA polymerase sigma factor (sigma-70 family)